MISRIKRMFRDESGQTQTEYLMIVGLMAVVIVTVFVTLFWPQVRAAVTDMVSRITEAVGGGGIN